MAASVLARCRELARLSEDEGGLCRCYLTPEHKRANALVGRWMREAGMRVRQDAVGNICGRYEGAEPGMSAVLLGSHLDTVRDAGIFDGALGVLAAVEITARLHRDKLRLPLALETIGFGDEEGVRFGVTLTCSRAVAGTWDDAWLACRDESGVPLRDALAEFGLNPAEARGAGRSPAEIAAYLELHIEQGVLLEKARVPLGVVSAVNGARRVECCFYGQSGHAGIVPMGGRKDALAGAAEWISAVERAAEADASGCLATVGFIQCGPNVVNVIPGLARMRLDLRGPDEAALDCLYEEILRAGASVAGRRALSFTHEQFYRVRNTPTDARLRSVLGKSIRRVQKKNFVLSSNAGHDALALAALCPVGMIFVRCRGGVSHHPDESVETADVAAALSALMLALADIGHGALQS
ncbi:MAG: allantoate amidohydrolase [Desulfovibrio sp.]|jgi:allantoate deiminase|nr:allantoate amidohydrolase [Desulfovibrio sp.]